MILVSAPSAFGKTTLLSEWLRQLNLPSAWLTVDVNDNELFQFVSYFLAALEQLAPGAGEETRRLVAASTLPPLPALVTALANDLAALPTEAVIVLDDLHTVAEPAIHELLDRLLPYLPPRFHLVISTRVDPPLSLVTLRARAQLAELRQRDLLLTRAEIDAFLARVGPPGVDEETSAALAQRTGGWSGGLRLFLYSARDAETLKALTHQSEMPPVDITTYFTNEVLHHAPQPIQRFLRFSAITESFNLSLCQALFHDSFSEQTLLETYEQVVRSGYFITSLGGGWYSYHALFREVLLNELRCEESSETIAKLHRSAARYYEGQGQIRLAIRHLLFVSEDEMAVALMAHHRIELLNRSAWTQLAARLAVFPTHMMTEYPELGICAAWVAFNNSELNSAQSILDRVEAQLEHQRRERSEPVRMSLIGEANAIRGQILLGEGLPDQVPKCSRRALELLPADHAMARSLAYVNLVGVLNYQGHQDEARAALRRGVVEAVGSDDVFESHILLIRFVLTFLAGNMAEARSLAQRMLTVSERRGLSANALWAHYYLGRVAYTSLELELAQRHFEVVAVRRSEAQNRCAMGGYLGLIQILCTRGQSARALQMLDEAETFATQFGPWLSQRWISTFRAYLFLLQGRIEQALAYVVPESEDLPLVPTMLSHFEAPLISLRILASDESPTSQARVARLLSTYLLVAHRANASHITAELLAIQARCLLLINEPDAALARLKDAVTLAAREPSLRLLPDLGPVIVGSLMPLLEQLNQDGVAPGFLPKVLDVLSALRATPVDKTIKHDASTFNSELLGELRPREVEVLELLADGLSNREIADRLHLSPKTVENYTLSLYSKLQVNRRGRAVAKARAIGLLSP